MRRFGQADARRRPLLTTHGGPVALAHAVLLLAGLGACAGAQTANQGEPTREVWAFTAFWDPRSATSLARHGSELTAAVTTWIALDTLTGAPVTLYADSLRGSEPARMALLTSWFDDRFHPASVRRLASDPDRLARAAAFTARALQEGGHRGLVLDFEEHSARDLPTLLRVVRTIADTLAAHRLGPLAIAIPAMDTAAYPARALLEAGADFVIPMLYDQHWGGGNAGPVAAPDWVARALDVRLRETDASRIVAGLPLYGYQWARAGAGQTVTHAEAVQRAADAGARLERDSATATLRATLPAGDEIWVTDATLLGQLLTVVHGAGINRVALWHIGQEDPAVWPLLRERLPPE